MDVPPDDQEPDPDEEKSSDEAVFLTNDRAFSWKDAVLTDADREIVRTTITGEGAIKLAEADGDAILAPAIVMQEVTAAPGLSRGKAGNLTLFMGKKQAAFVRDLRVEKLYSWRAVAQACYDAWGGDWEPSFNQLVGMAFCEVAARRLGENYLEEPWN